MPDSIELHISNIHTKLQLLLKKHTTLLKENQQLKKEIEGYESKEKNLIEKADQLQLQVNILKASAGKLEGEEKSAFEKSINRYIRSIDKCINILNE